MSSECNGECSRREESQLRLGYGNGQKYCKKCHRYFLTDEIRCKCCKNVLRSKKKHNKIPCKNNLMFLINEKTIYNNMTLSDTSKMKTNISSLIQE